MCSSLFSPVYKGVAAVQGRAIDNPHAALLSRVACRFLLVKPSQSGQIRRVPACLQMRRLKSTTNNWGGNMNRCSIVCAALAGAAALLTGPSIAQQETKQEIKSVLGQANV
ncbi:hypothetical protein, partial [Bradyrhizobium sp.]|uniref:hypothetical protein n=1 Tax=Bradyrhizobium sp. TaxID=376 RepID=UPI003C78E45E